MCGKKLITQTVGAETIVEYRFAYGNRYRPYTAYDVETGNRNWATRYYCPNANWLNSHTDFTVRAFLLN